MLNITFKRRRLFVSRPIHSLLTEWKWRLKEKQQRQVSVSARHFRVGQASRECVTQRYDACFALVTQKNLPGTKVNTRATLDFTAKLRRLFVSCSIQRLITSRKCGLKEK